MIILQRHLFIRHDRRPVLLAQLQPQLALHRKRLRFGNPRLVVIVAASLVPPDRRSIVSQALSRMIGTGAGAGVWECEQIESSLQELDKPLGGVRQGGGEGVVREDVLRKIYIYYIYIWGGGGVKQNKGERKRTEKNGRRITPPTPPTKKGKKEQSKSKKVGDINIRKKWVKCKKKKKWKGKIKRDGKKKKK